MLNRIRSFPIYGILVATCCVLVALSGTAVAAGEVPFAKRAGTAKKATNATKVGGIRASRKPRAKYLLPLDAQGKFPLSVMPQGITGVLSPQGPQGRQGPQGPQGPKGDTGTVDTSNFFTKSESDGRFLGISAKAADSHLLDGRDSGGFFQINPAARQDAPPSPAGTPALWLRSSPVAGGVTSEALFKVQNDSGFVADGDLGVGTIPAEGPGERMMWHPFKAAFRAGGTNDGALGDAWNDGNVGFYSWAGGNLTRATAFATFAFGDQATASGVDSVAFGASTLSSGTAAFTSGAANKAQGFASTALGYTNRAAGQGSQALGYRVAAVGDYSVALGHRAVDVPCSTVGPCAVDDFAQSAGQDGTFTFADFSSTNYFPATASNQFSVRAAGGVRLRTNSTLSTGCDLPAGTGTWSCTSDRNAKRDFAAVDGASVLARLRRVPITTWAFKTDKRSNRHMGPMAQDFRRAFRLGTDDRHIDTVDAQGVTLAAIQELDRRSRRQEAEIRELRRTVARLTQRP